MCSQVQAGQPSVSEGDAERVMTTWSFQTVVGGPFLFLYLPPIGFPSACSSAGRISLLFSKGDGGEGRHSSNRHSARVSDDSE